MELLVAVTIMGALVLMAQGTYVVYMRDSVESALRHNLFQLRAAIQQFYADHGRYPYDRQDAFGNRLGFLDTATSELTQGVRVGPGNVYPDERVRYLLEIPIDPTTNQINWILLPNDNDGDWQAFSDSGQPAASNDFENGEGNGIWDAGVEALNDDAGDPQTEIGGNPDTRFGRGDGRPTRGEPRVDEDPFDGINNDGDVDPVTGEQIIDEDPFDVRDVVSANPDYRHL